MKSYLSILVAALLVGCGGGGSSSSSSTPEAKTYSLDEVFSSNTISPKDSLGSINKEDFLNGFLEFPQEVELTNEADIKSYLENRYSITLASSPSIKKGLKFTSYKYLQDNAKARECGSSINLTLDEQNKVFKTYIYKINDFATCQRAEGYFEKPRDHKLSEPAALNEGTLVETTIKVFDPDPLTASKGELTITNAFEDLEIADSLYSLKNVQVLKKGDDLYFSNNRVKAVDIISMQSSSQGPLEPQDNQQGVFTSKSDFTKDIKDKQFLEQMAFYHIDDSLKYLESLGYTSDKAIFDAPLMFDAQVSVQNQSSYLSDIKIVSFGTGGAPDTVDADIVRHELAHAINYHIASDFDSGDTGAIGEGFADYWAGYYSYYIQKDDEKIFEDNLVFNFDGNYGPNKTKRSLNNPDGIYNPFSIYRAHVKVNGVNADELWSAPLYSTLKDSLALYGDEAYDEVNIILLESFSGIGYGIKMLQMADSIVKTAKKLYPNKDYSKIFLANFKKHNIIQEKILFVSNNNFITKDTNLELSFSNIYFENLENLNMNIESNSLSLKSKNFTDSKFEKTEKANKSLEFTLNDNLICSSSLDLNISSSFNYEKQRSDSFSNSISLVYGKPLFESVPKTVDKTIPNAKETGNNFNPITTVPLNFPMEMTKDELIADDFAFILELSSKDISKVNVNLITPDKEKISLVSKDDYSTTNLKKVYTVKNDDRFKNLKNKNYKGSWYLNIENRGLDNQTILYRYGINKIKKYDCN